MAKHATNYYVLPSSLNKTYEICSKYKLINCRLGKPSYMEIKYNLVNKLTFLSFNSPLQLHLVLNCNLYIVSNS